MPMTVLRACIIMLAWAGPPVVMLSGCRENRDRPVELQPEGIDHAPSEPPPSAAPTEEDRRRLLALGVIIPMPALPPAAQPSNSLPADAKAEIEQAQSLVAEDRYTEATQALERVLRDHGEAAEVHSAIAAIALAQGQRDRARAHANQAVELNPRDAKAHYLLGRLAVDDGQFDEAMTSFRKGQVALEVETSDPSLPALLHFQLAQVLEREGYWAAALQQYEAYAAGSSADASGTHPVVGKELTTLRSSIGPAAGAQRARLLELMGRKREALDLLAGMMGSPQETPAMRGQYVALLADAGDATLALAEARALVRRDPDRVALLVDLHRKRGSLADLVSDLEQLLNDHPDHEALAAAYVEAVVEAMDSASGAEKLRLASTGSAPDSALRWRWAELLYLDLNRPLDAFVVAGEALTDGADADGIRQRLAHWHAQKPVDEIAPPTGKDSPGLLAVLGMQAEIRGDKPAAQALFRRAIDADPTFVVAILELAEHFRQAYAWDEMLKVIGAYPPDAPPDGRLLWMKGIALAGLDRPEEAVDLVTQAAGLRRTDARIRRTLADLHRRAGRNDLAIQQFQAAIEANSLDEASREGLFWLYYGEGRLTEADEQLQQMRRMGANAARVARCVAYLELDPRKPDWGRFRTTIESAMDAGQPDPESLHHLGLSWLRQGERDRAREFFERELAVDPSKDEAVAQLAMIHTRELRFAEAESQYRELLRRYPRRSPTLTLLLDNLLTQQKFDEAVSLAEASLQIPTLAADDRSTFRTFVSEALEAAGRSDRFIEHFRRWRASDPKDELLYEFLVNVDKDQVDEALAILAEAEQDGILDPQDFRLRLALLVRGERHLQARQLLLDQIEDAGDNDRQLLTLISMLRLTGSYTTAIELARGLKERTRYEEQYADSILQTHIEAGQYDQAIEMVREILRENAPPPEIARGLYDTNQLLLVDLLQRTERFDEAQRMVSQWVAQTADPEPRSLCWSTLANLHSVRGQTQQAVEAMEKAYELRPGDPRICNDFGYMLADAGLRLDEAEKLIRAAVGSSPRQMAYLDSLGWVLYKKGDLAGAVHWLTMATRTGDEADPVVIDHLADALWRLGRREEALEQWRKAVSLVEQPIGERAVESIGPVDNPQTAAVVARARQKLDAAQSGAEPDTASIIGLP